MKTDYSRRLQYVVMGLFVCIVAASSSANTIVDVMIVYDASARSWLQSEGISRLALAQDAVERMNTAAINTELDVRFQLVHVLDANYTTAGTLSADLANLDSGAVLSSVRQARDQYQADLVSMMVRIPGATGLGDLLLNEQGNPDDAFSVCEVNLVRTSHTLTHEIGHNFGCDHSREQMSYPGPNAKLNHYSAGYYFVGAQTGDSNRTIMAYAHQGYTKQVPIFSSPQIRWQGTYAGIADRADNARTIRETMLAVSRYRGYGPLKPNLVPFRKSFWSDKIVVSRAPNVVSNAANLLTTDTLYAHFGVGNIGARPTTVGFNAKLYLNGAEIASQNLVPFDVGSFYGRTNIYLGQLAAGTYTLRVVVDTAKAVDEMDENDNIYEKPFIVGGGVVIPGAPSLTTPAHQANIVGSAINFAWSTPSGNPSKYHLQVSTYADMSSPAYSNEDLPGTSRELTNFPNNGTRYYWRVRAWNSAGWGPWSAIREVVNGSGVVVPGTPSLNSPAHLANVAGSAINFAWSTPSGNPSKYHLQVSTYADMSSPTYSNEDLPGTSRELTNFPNNGTRYYWRVRAWNSAGWGPWSTIREVVNGSFSVVPGAPSLVSPSQGATIHGSDVTFSWSTPSGSPSKYQLQISANSGFSPTAYDSATITSTSQPLTGFPDDGSIVYWRVRAFNSVGWGSWSATRSFVNGGTTSHGDVTCDFDGDGRSDYGVYYPPQGLWYRMLSRDGFKTTQFGFGGTLPIAGDWDGDGRADYGCYHPQSGNWYRMMSKDGFKVTQFGFGGTLPIVGDWDGDGKDDYGCYYPPSGTWYRMLSKDGFKITQFGFGGTLPIVGDWDGDGKDDYGCYHPPSGIWYRMMSKDGFRTTQFGFGGTLPIVGDWDGDGKDDYGCYYPPSGTWYRMMSTQGFKTTQFGFGGTIPIAGDWDGDRKDDYGCYHPPSGTWYRMMSKDGFKTTQFGFSGTVPLGR